MILQPHVVIIGAGFAGLRPARKLAPPMFREESFEANLFDDHSVCQYTLEN